MSPSSTRLAYLGALMTGVTLTLSGCVSTQSSEPMGRVSQISNMPSLKTGITPSGGTLPTNSAQNVTSALPATSQQASGEIPAGSAYPDSPDSASTDDSGGGNSGLVTGSVGQDISTNQYTVKVNSVKDNVQGTGSFGTPDAGQQFVDVNVTVTNKSNQKLFVSPFQIKGTLTDNTSAKISLLAEVGTPLPSEDLYQGDTATGDVVYQVPTGDNLKRLDINFLDLSFGNSQAIRVNINN